MRKLTSTLLLSLLLFGASKAQTIFDPETFAGTLPSGMEIVTIEGTKYLQVVLDGWNSNLDIDYTIGSERGVACKFKFAKGPADTITVLTQINATVQLKDTVNLVPASWDPGTMVPADLSLTQNPPSIGAFQRNTGTCREEMQVIHQLQFSAQEKYNWGALVGDTMWVGKIYTIDPTVLFDPATFEGTLPAGMEIVDEGGTKLLKVTVDGWNTTLDIDAFSMGDNNHWSMQAKMEVGTSGQKLDSMNTFIQAMVGGTGSFSVGAASSATLKTYEGDAKPDVTVTQLQFAAQKNYDDWAAQVGAIIYVGKITVSYVQPEAAPPRATYDVPYLILSEYIAADGIISPDEFWNDVTAANIDRQALPADETPLITDSKGTMKLAWDEYYLYVLVDAEDATPINFPAGSEKAWENDGAELFVDMLNRRYVGQKRITDEQHQLRFNLGRTDADTSAIMYPGVAEKVVWGQVAGGNGWRLEAQIPWPNMCHGIVDDEDIDQFVLDSVIENKKIGWEVSILNANVADTRNSIMNWANDQKDDMAYNTNEFWGEITLTGGPSGIKSYDVIQLRIYPNPANKIIHIMNSDVISYRILDISGRIVAEGLYPDNGINISTLKSGLYFLNAVDINNNLNVNKFLKR